MRRAMPTQGVIGPLAAGFYKCYGTAAGVELHEDRIGSTHTVATHSAGRDILSFECRRHNRPGDYQPDLAGKRGSDSSEGAEPGLVLAVD